MRRPPAIIHLTDEERGTLQQWTRRGKKEHRLVERAKIILFANEGRTNQQIADALKTGQRAFRNGGSGSGPSACWVGVMPIVPANPPFTI